MMMNRMSILIDKIERRLGTAQLTLPDIINKNTWSNIINADTLDTFSRYFPRKLTIYIDKNCSKSSDGFFLIDDCIQDNVEILGVGDINWDMYGLLGSGHREYGMQDLYTDNFNMDDAMLFQGYSDLASIFSSCTIYIDFQFPNKLKFIGSSGQDLFTKSNKIPVDIYVKHPSNLMSISPTKMETFEALAMSDIASYLYNYLKYYDGVSTVFANIDLKLSELQSWAERREDIVNRLNESYVGPSNEGQSFIFTV